DSRSDAGDPRFDEGREWGLYSGVSASYVTIVTIQYGTSVRKAPCWASTRMLPESIFHPVTSDVSNIRNRFPGTERESVPSRNAELNMCASSSSQKKPPCALTLPTKSSATVS